MARRASLPLPRWLQWALVMVVAVVIVATLAFVFFVPAIAVWLPKVLV